MFLFWYCYLCCSDGFLFLWRHLSVFVLNCSSYSLFMAHIMSLYESFLNMNLLMFSLVITLFLIIPADMFIASLCTSILCSFVNSGVSIIGYPAICLNLLKSISL